MELVEKYRPKELDEVVGQAKAVATVRSLIARDSLGGRKFWVSGPSGTGKTTLAYIIARHVADDMYIEELDAGRCTDAYLRQIEADCQYGAFGKGGRAYIINEAHGLSAKAVRQCLVWLERLPAHVVVIFTTTTEGLQLTLDGCDGKPLVDRCTKLQLTNQGLCKPFAERAKAIAEAEGLDGQPLSRYERLAKESKNSMRAMLQAIDEGELLTA